MRTVVVFRSNAFGEATEATDNPEPAGKDLAQWLSRRLRDAGVAAVGEPGQEDFGWYVEFTIGTAAHCFVVGARPRDDNSLEWVGWVERSRGFVGSLLGLRNKDILAGAVDALHSVLSGAAEVSAIVWHEKSSFDRSREEHGSPTPK